MAFGGFGSTGFGAAAPASPFGQTSTPAFGSAPASPFGAQPAAAAPSPFGAPAATPAFGQTSPSTGFGAAATPAFGGGGFGGSTSTFGAQPQAASAFGAKPATGGGFGSGFGAATAAQSPFGTQSTPAFGASTASVSGFGATNASPFGGGSTLTSQPTFGASATTPSFGGAPGPAFGAASPTPAFGGSVGGGMFGASSAANTGTRSVPYQPLNDQDQSSSGTSTRVNYHCISAMQQYNGKSMEELRWEDYSAGVKGNAGGAAATGGFGSTAGAFGAGAAPSPFGAAPAAAPSPFGASAQPTFGASTTPAFGTTATSSPFGASSTPAFGASQPTQQPAFGSSTPAFGSSAPAASAFGSSTPAFGATGASPFGAASTTPAFGSNTASTPAFGTSPTPAFGSSTTSAFGATPATSAPAFGASGGAFGAAPAATTGAFGSSTPAFGASNAFGGSSAFGSTAAPFGAPTSSAPGAFGSTGASTFGATTASTSLFGSTSTSAFGAPQASSAFGAPSTPSLFGSTPSAFGASTPASTGFGALGASTSLFGAAAQKPAGTGLMPASGGAFSFAQTSAAPFGAATPGSTAAATPPGIAQSPYGALPQPPSIGNGSTVTPNMKVGISQRPVGGSSGVSVTSLITPRTIMPRSGARMRARRTPAASQMSKNGVAASPVLAICSSSPASSTFTPRDNPRRLFIREAPPPPVSGSRPESSATPAPLQNGIQSSDLADSPATPGTAPSHFSNCDLLDAAKQSRKETLAVHDSWSNDEALNDTLKGLLPSLTREDYFMEPSLESLSSMARDDPSSLKNVRAFTVGRHGFGQIQWLGMVDVRGLDLDKLVHIRSKALEVYPEDTDKPPRGSGLNKPAMVTLLKVFKIDKSTRLPTKEESAIKKFRRRLIEHSAEQESKFVSYNVDSGEWVFEVAHFSRYGLDDADSDSEDEDIDIDDLQNVGVSRRQETCDFETQGTVEEESEGGHDKPVDNEIDGGDSELQAVDDMIMDDNGASSADEYSGLEGHLDGVVRSRGATLLTHSLPSNLQLDVDDLVGMQSSLPGQLVLDVRANQQSDKTDCPNFCQGTSAKHAWSTSHSALKRACHRHQNNLASTPPVQGRLPTPAMSTGFDGTPMATRGSPQHQPTKLGDVGHFVGQTHSCVDTGLLMGRSFRVGWGPGGTLLVPSLGLSHLDVPHARIRVTRLVTNYERCKKNASCFPEQDSKEAATRAKARFVQSLNVHQKFSCKVNSPSDCTVPLRVLSVSSQRLALSRVCNEFYTTALEGHNDTPCELEKVVAAHQMGAWQLVLELFSAVDCHDVSSATEEEGDTFVLQELRRRGMVSSLFRQLVRTTVQKEIESSEDPEQLVMSWLTGHELAPALAAATARGDVRLATLIAATSTGNVSGRAAAGEQVRIWVDRNLHNNVSPLRMGLYKLLAGDVPGATMAMNLDWRRNMCLHMWYGMPATSGLSDILQVYLSDVRDKKASPPIPSYSITGSEFDVPEDTWFGLLCLQASIGKEGISDSAVKSLFYPASHTPDPLDHTFNWMLIGILQDLGALEHHGIAHQAVNTENECLFRLVSAVVAHAEYLCEPLLAIYAACHIPDHPHVAGLRDTAVRKLLMHYAPKLLFRADGAGTAVKNFLCNDLCVPMTWIAESLATWARDNGDTKEQLQQLMNAECWADAHEVLMCDVAPAMILDGMFKELLMLFATLEPHSALLETWPVGGSIFSEYLRLKTGEPSSCGMPRLDRVIALGSVLSKASTFWLSINVPNKNVVHLDGGGELLAMAWSRLADDCASWAMMDMATMQPGGLEQPEFALSGHATSSQYRGYHIHAAVTSVAHAISSLG